MNVIELGLTGASLAIFLSLLAVMSLVLGGATAHTNAMLESVENYNADPGDENLALLQEEISSSDNYLRDISSVSSEALLAIMDTMDTGILSDGGKESLGGAKEFLGETGGRDISDPDAIEMREKLASILEKLDGTNG